ncbi:hypothetical protein IRZ71_24585 [Flavobacterium sp. ANB]|uniref:hypothetical protein n=1 Tax=unclassified Flavobacterium TaxID=196869 RepID=UPI0012B72D63|nr:MULTISPECIES: hypothetical protein [unclassified Flavobacterium]MBF4519529.1 hypothetical protein [Flavobacterium sp. ANB]MTD72399.1 hypothetical protein [Flavobacterium sp. LC2016-13]
MKKALLICFLFIFSIANSQNLTIKQLLSLKGVFISEVYNDLTKKGWKFCSEDNKKNGGQTTYLYTEKNGNYYFLTLSYPEDYHINNIRLQFLNSEKCKLYLNQIKALGFKKKSSLKEKNNITKIFENSKTIIKFVSENKKREYEHEFFYFIYIVGK